MPTGCERAEVWQKIKSVHTSTPNTALLMLIVLNILVRIPLVPHEIGSDSFLIHNLADSVVKFGYAKWVIHPLSIFGLYPFSTPSAVPIFIGGLSRLTSLGVEQTIALFSIGVGILSVFTSYVMAQEVINDERFMLLTAFSFSLSPLMLKFSIWTASSRGLFLALLPLFLWAQFSSERRTRKANFVLLSALILILAMTHKMFIFLLPLIFIDYLLEFQTKFEALFLEMINKRWLDRIKSPFFVLLALTSVFASQFLFPQRYWVFRYGFFGEKDVLTKILSFAIIIGARMGVALLFSLVGIVILIFEKNKTKIDKYLILTLFIFSPFLSYTMTFYQFLLPFFSLLAAYGVLKIAGYLEDRPSFYFISMMLLLTIAFSVHTLNVRFTNTDNKGFHNYADEEIYRAGVFLKGSIPPGSTIGGIEGRKVVAISENPLVTDETVLLGDFINLEAENITRRPLPKNVEQLFGFVKMPYTYTADPKFTYEYMVELEGEVNPRLSERAAKVYTNRRVSIWK